MLDYAIEVQVIQAVAAPGSVHGNRNVTYIIRVYIIMIHNRNNYTQYVDSLSLLLYRMRSSMIIQIIQPERWLQT